MRRWCLSMVFGFFGVVLAFAESGDPYTYVPTKRWAGRIINHAADTSRGIVLSQPTVWSGQQAPLTLIHDGLAEGRSFNGAQVVAASYWGGDVVVILSTDAGFEIALFDQDVRQKRKSAILDVGRTTQGIVKTETARLLINDNVPLAFLQIGGSLYWITKSHDELEANLLENHVLACDLSTTQAGWELQYIHTVGSSAFVSIFDQTRRVVATRMVPNSTHPRIERRGGTIAVIANLDDASGCVTTIIDRSSMNMRSRSFPVPSSQVALLRHNNQDIVAIVTTRSGRAELIGVNPRVGTELPSGIFISGEFGAPYSLVARGDTLCIVFSGGIVVMTVDGSILARDALSTPWRSIEVETASTLSAFTIVSPHASIRFERRPQTFWFVYRGFDALLRYVLPLLFAGSLGFVWVLNRRQRRLLDAIIDSPATGLVLTIDNSGRLLRTNDRASSVLRILPNVPMRRHFRAYMQAPGLEQLVAYLDSIGQSRIEPNKRIALQVGEEQREYICSMTPLVGMFGGARGAIISAIDITETLEQRRLVNWAQLAHDMQTNLSTIRLNAEQLPMGEDGGISERRRRILFQVGVLIDRVRDLLSIGRTDDVIRAPVHSAELCTEVRHEFDSEMFPHVKFSMKLRGTMMNVDRLKVSRAVRNAVENAIKALRGLEGTIEISTWHDRTNVFISVSDTGVGMDPETMANMMKPYFSTSHDGSGHGIGTMIMHHVMKLHGGAIRVTSEPGQGSQVIFRIPHEMDPKDVLRMTANDR